MDIKKINLNETMTSFSRVGCTRLELFVHLLGLRITAWRCKDTNINIKSY